MTHSHPDTGTYCELLDLAGDALRSYWAEVTVWLRHSATFARHIVDLGAGTGTGAIALAQRFGAAEITAVDTSAELLHRACGKALDLGLDDRIRTVRADLDVTWPALAPIDLTWASMSLHHVADPDRVLRNVFEATRPGGLIAVAELGEELRFLPDAVGDGLETRCLEASAAEHAELLPHLGSAWAPRVEAAGFALVTERTFHIDLRPPHPSVVARYARANFSELRSGLGQRLSANDLDTLAELIDGTGPDSLMQRSDLHVRGSRVVTLGQRRRD